jgi:hypothetical protein
MHPHLLSPPAHQSLYTQHSNNAMQAMRSRDPIDLVRIMET